MVTPEPDTTLVNHELDALLLSNSKNAKEPFMAHAASWAEDMLKAVEDILLVPYACPPVSKAIANAVKFFQERGIKVVVANDDHSARDQVSSAGSIFALGGNTFRLLRHLYDHSLLAPLRSAVTNGTPFLGASAGCNIACPTISTTNDMPIAEPPSFGALSLIPFQINTHYVENEYSDNYTGESRRQRLEEYVAETGRPILALPEGTGLRVVGRQYVLMGETSAVLFGIDGSLLDVPPGTLTRETLTAFFQVLK